MTQDDLDKMKAAIDASAMKNAGYGFSPSHIAELIEHELNVSLSPASFKVRHLERDEDIVREVMEEPRDEMDFEIEAQLSLPLEFIHCHLRIEM